MTLIIYINLYWNRAKVFGAMFQNNILLYNYLTGSHIAFQLSRRPLVNACFLVVPFIVLSFIGVLPFCLPVEGKVCGKEHCFYIALLNTIIGIVRHRALGATV